MQPLMVLLVAELRSALWQAQRTMLHKGMVAEATKLADRVQEASDRFASRMDRLLDLNALTGEEVDTDDSSGPGSSWWPELDREN